MADKKFTDEINVALASITAANAAIKELMGSNSLVKRGQIFAAAKVIDVSVDRIYDRLRMIKNAVEKI